MVDEEFIIEYLKENKFRFIKEDYHIVVDINSKNLDMVNDELIPQLKSWEVNYDLNFEIGIVQIWSQIFN